MLVPPDNFGQVEKGVYRCSKLVSDNFSFLETLQLRSLVLVDAEKPGRSVTEFVGENNIEVYNLGGLKISNHASSRASKDYTEDKSEDIKKSPGDNTNNNSSNSNVTDRTERSSGLAADDLVVFDLESSKKDKNDEWMLIDRSLITSAFELILNKNKHNMLLVDSTSTLVGILRKIQKWNFNSIINEYRIYSGNSSKHNYFAENFLELIQVELIPYEIEQVNYQLLQQLRLASGTPKEEKSGFVCPEQCSEQGADFSKMIRSFKSYSLEGNDHNNNSIEEVAIGDNESEDDIEDEDDIDDELLSASPQIPANLLKLAEQRNQEKSGSISNISDGEITPGTSPNVEKLSRHNSFSSEMFLTNSRGINISQDRRRSSVSRMSNSRFRSLTQSPGSYMLPRRASFESRSPRFKKFRDYKELKNMSEYDIERIKEKYDFKYYKNLSKFLIEFDGVSEITLKLPPDNKLPDWFIRGRNYWEASLRKLNGI
ncbi:uncharacterized protein KQ657_002855 [Scheffersomyces spartinae]|uniref:Uncharacterized protein n=1 Tax=Scheffersomyces spartinae TaxID=45513 RepID=A0A9P7V6B3_9ASCO|nr:uncharacterized protein KQ657_002855 [Scheffersomyces spartinae]KAG7191719.1 hypothetical protein KQ657_002855 [Scheffersomyces spartinae]